MPPPIDPKSLPLFGRCALEEGHLTEDQLDPILSEPLDTTQDDGSVTFANLCLKRGLLTPVQVMNLLLVQNYRELRIEDEALASIAVQRGLADEEVVRFALEAQSKEFVAERKLPRRLGDILIEAEVLNGQDLAMLKSELARTRQRPPAPRPAPPPKPAYVPPPPPADTLGWLIIEFGDEIGRRLPVGTSAVIGRFPSGDIPIHDPRISRQHARIEITDGTDEAFLIDLGSKNGTFVNQERVTGRIPLNSGDLIRIGMSVLRFKSAADALSGVVPQVKETPASTPPGPAMAPPASSTRTGGPAPEPPAGKPGDNPPEFSDGRDITLPLIG